MLTVLIYWIYLTFVFLVFGVLFSKIFRFENKSPFITLLLGSFLVTILATIWACFGSLGFIFESLLGTITIAGLFLLTSDIRKITFSLKAKIVALSSYSKFIILLVIFITVAKSAGVPYIIDNESYYLQTIEWLDSYGFVKGVANIHPFLMQFSGWHILQAATNFDYTHLQINDLSGYILLLGLIYATISLDHYFKCKRPYLLYTGLFLLFSLFLVQFISAPSPDVPVYVLALVVFTLSYKWSHSESIKDDTIHIAFLLAVFATFIKLTAVLLILFTLVVYVHKRVRSLHSLVSKKLIPVSLFALLTFILFVVKNYIISGYALFPLSISVGNPDWAVPQSIILWYRNFTVLDAFQTQDLAFFKRNFFYRFQRWLFLDGIDGIVNKLISLTLLLFPLVIWLKKWNKTLIIFYFITVLHFILLWFNAPQFRFFFLFFTILITVSGSLFLRNRILIKSMVILSLAITMIPIIFPVNLGSLSHTPFLSSLTPLTTDQLFVPHPVTRYSDLNFNKKTLGNLEYQSPIDSAFFWASGDCEVPCVNKAQLDYFEIYFHIIPQMRGATLDDGFYAKQILNE